MSLSPTTLSMYQASAPVLIRALENLINILEKGKAHAAAKGTDEANYLSMRLAPDMLPFTSQIRIATDIARRGMARLAGVEHLAVADEEVSFDDLITRCRVSIDNVKSFTPDQIDGTEEKEILLPTPFGELKFTGQQFLFGFILANVHFHATMTYALLRGAGVELGKRDYLGG
jgi:uncharacterized protein